MGLVWELWRYTLFIWCDTVGFFKLWPLVGTAVIYVLDEHLVFVSHGSCLTKGCCSMGLESKRYCKVGNWRQANKLPWSPKSNVIEWAVFLLNLVTFRDKKRFHAFFNEGHSMHQGIFQLRVANCALEDHQKSGDLSQEWLPGVVHCRTVYLKYRPGYGHLCSIL